MPKKIYYRVFYCSKCGNLYTKGGYSKHCWGGHDFDKFTLAITKNDEGINVEILKGVVKYNVG